MPRYWNRTTAQRRASGKIQHHVIDISNDDDAGTEVDETRMIRWRTSYTMAVDKEGTVDTMTAVEDLIYSYSHPEEDRDNTAEEESEEAIPTLLLSAVIVEELAAEDVALAVQTFLSKTAEYQVEVWGTAGAPLPLRPLEGYQSHIHLLSDTTTTITVDERNSRILQACRAMQEYGMVVQPQLFDEDVVGHFRAIVDEAIENIENLLSKYRPELIVGKDILNFREIASRNKQRFDLRLDLLSGDTFHRPPAVDLVQQLVKQSPYMQEFLCQAMHVKCEDYNAPIDIFHYVDFDVSVVYSRPGAGAQGWHADGSHLPGAPEAGWNDDATNSHQLAHPHAVCVFVPLIDLNESVGYTQFWPGSHAHRKLVGLGPFAQVTQSVWDSKNCQAGDGVWYDYRLMHQGMPHASDSSISLRPVVQIIFKQKWYVERANYGEESIIPTKSRAQ